MSRPLKKHRAVFPLEEDVSEGEEVIDELIGQTINVDFDAFKAETGDFHGIKQLLQQNLRGLDLDISGIADIIISQNYVGSVVKQVIDEDDDGDDGMDQDYDDDNQIFGVTTVINLTSRKDEEPIRKLRSALVEKCLQHGSDSTNVLVRESLGNENKHVGFLLSERLVNLPAQFALPVYESLLKELKDARKANYLFDFTYLVLISKLYKEAKKKNQNNSDSNFMWSNAEEEIFSEECLTSFDYPVKGDNALSGEWDECDQQYVPLRRVLIFDATKLADIIRKVRQAVS